MFLKLQSFLLHNQGGAVIRVMDGAALSVRPGECVGLTGASGSGKSTVAKRIIGLVDGAGEISLGGSKIDTPTGAEWRGLRRRIQYFM